MVRSRQPQVKGRSPLTVLSIFSGDCSSETFFCYGALGLVDKILTATHCILLLDIAVV